MGTSTPAERAAAPAATAIVHRGELDYLSRCILDYPGIETGGELFGYWTASGVPVVLYAIGPGPNANHEAAFFNQDLGYLRRVGGRLVSAYGLQHVGEWHSHHRLGLAKPSGHDAQTMVRCIAEGGLGRFLLCIANVDDAGTRSTINAFAFHQGAGYAYRHAAWDVKEGESPYRAVVDRDPELAGVLVHPATKTPAMDGLLLATGEDQLVPPDYGADHWLNRRENNLALKRIVDFLGGVAPADRVLPRLDAEGRVVLAVDRPDRRETILFPRGFPLEPPALGVEPAGDTAERPSLRARWFGPRKRPADGSDPAPPDWTYAGDVFRAFEHWYRAAFAPDGNGPAAAKEDKP